MNEINSTLSVYSNPNLTFRVVLEYWRQWNAMEKTDYSAPAIEIIDVAVEQGFALSGEPINENTPLTW